MRVPALLLGAILPALLFPLSYPQSPTSFVGGPAIPPNFNVDIETGARLRSRLLPGSIAPTGRYAIGSAVFERLLHQVAPPASTKFAWALRIVDGDQFNAYSSPEGTIYVETSLAQLVERSTGLWAAILSHEIAHVMRRDWARRSLYQDSLGRSSARIIVLGEPGFPSAEWLDSQTASAKLGEFCRQLELDADRDSLMLMARAGYHPDFVPALHHLLHANGSGAVPRSLDAMHPCWEERDQGLLSAYASAAIEFDHRWPEWYASPGGNPPIVVFASTPTVKRINSREREIRVTMRCQNLAGAVEVVLHAVSAPGNVGHAKRSPGQAGFDIEQHEVTGCTSPLTTVIFRLPGPHDVREPGIYRADVSVFDGWGAVLAHLEIPRLPH